MGSLDDVLSIKQKKNRQWEKGRGSKKEKWRRRKAIKDIMTYRTRQSSCKRHPAAAIFVYPSHCQKDTDQCS